MGRRLTLIMGFMVTMLAALGVVSYAQSQLLRDMLARILAVAEPTSRVAMEMETNLYRTGFVMLSYLHDRNPRHLQEIRADRAEFTALQKRYTALADSSDALRDVETIRTQYDTFTRGADSLIELDRQQNAIFPELIDSLERLDRMLNEGARVLGHSGATAKLDLVSDMANVANTMSKDLGRVLRTGEAQGAQRFDADVYTFKQLHARFRAIELTTGERRLADNSAEEFDRITTGVHEVTRLEHGKETGVVALVAIRSDLENTLRGNMRNRATRVMLTSFRSSNTLLDRFNLLSALLVAIGLVAAGVEALWMRRTILRPIERLIAAVRQMATGAAPAVVVDSDDEFGELAEAFNHMTTQRQAAEATTRHLASIVSSSGDAILSVTLDGTITTWNFGCERQFEYRSNVITGQSLTTLTTAAGAQQVPELLVRVGRGERIERYHSVWYGEGGRAIDVSLTISPIRDAAGAVAQASIIARDITERNRAEAQLSLAVEELARSNRELEAFAYVASHDLQEPLRKVRNYAELLSDRYKGHLDAKGDKFIEYIVDGATRMHVMIRDLLAYSRVGRGDVPKELTPLDEVFDRVCSTLDESVRETGAIISKEALPAIVINPMLIEQLLQNLIGNAIKFRQDGQAPRIRVSARRDDDEWIVAVTDDGIGIDKEFYDRIFGIFQRLNNKVDYPGSGIGLAICKRIAERHGGRIWVEPAPGGGTIFLFALPVGQEEYAHAVASR